MPLPLKGIKILDLSRFIAGPWCAMLLGDMGAKVIKVEKPVTGDDSRSCGPFYKGKSIYYNMYNRNKASLTLNLYSKEGKDILRNLISWSDIVIENFRPGVLEKIGFPFKSMQQIKRDIILLSISGFGQKGPYVNRPCFDTIAQAMSGLMDLTGKPEDIPTRVGIFIGDFVAGIYGALGIMLCLFERQYAEKGRHIDIAMLDSIISLMETNLAEYQLTGVLPTRTGNRRLFAAPVDSFKTRDGYIFINVSTNAQWENLCDVLGRGDFKKDPRFSNPFLRGENHEEIYRIVNEWVCGHSSREAMEALNDASVPTSIINDVSEVIKNPQLIFRGSLIEMQIPEMGNVLMPANPIRFIDQEKIQYSCPPDLGEQADSILKMLGYSKIEINRFKDEGVI